MLFYTFDGLIDVSFYCRQKLYREFNWFGWWKRACRGVGFPSTFPLADIPASTGMFGCPVGCRLVKLGEWKFPPYVSVQISRLQVIKS